jgi:hypothetical protein
LRELVVWKLTEQVAPIQLAIRLLITEGSLLLELPEIRAMVEPFDHEALCYPWRNAEPSVDRLAASILKSVRRADCVRASRSEIFRAIWDLAGAGTLPPQEPRVARAAIPYLTEPWYC